MKWATILGCTAAIVLLAGRASASDVLESVTNALRDQGYVRIQVTDTLLGRIRIRAASSDKLREIVLDRRTGEILRDYWEPFPGRDDAAAGNGMNGIVQPVQADGKSADGEQAAEEGAAAGGEEGEPPDDAPGEPDGERGSGEEESIEEDGASE